MGVGIEKEGGRAERNEDGCHIVQVGTDVAKHHYLLILQEQFVILFICSSLYLLLLSVLLTVT